MAMRGFVGGMCVVATGLTLAALVACGSGEPSCAEAVAAAEAEVRTTPWESPEDLPGLAHPAETHWQLKALGEPCSRAPGPTDWAYQGVVRLGADDVRALAAGYAWQPVGVDKPDNPVEPWPALAPFVPSGVRWMRSDAYDDAQAQARWRRVYFDPARSVALFELDDH